MRFSVAAVITFAIGAFARPSGPSSPFPRPGGDVTVSQAGDTCGSEMELSCCNHVDQSGDSVMEASGILAGALQGVLADGELGLFSGCSKLNVAALIGLSDFLDQQCKQTAACCQHSGTTQEGLVNVGLPCVALGSVL
ncbi:putative rodlet peptide [Rosellinia necatrix]|uniref:Hydrophobin n=1 Tax=Rosellinia necatrix TaxID=77044 RepID=A0A1W2TX97_ROSNE|nr:putative rodlet peptide [Rosellinia necatrix]